MITIIGLGVVNVECSREFSLPNPVGSRREDRYATRVSYASRAEILNCYNFI